MIPSKLPRSGHYKIEFTKIKRKQLTFRHNPRIHRGKVSKIDTFTFAQAAANQMQEVFNVSLIVRLETEKPITLTRPETLIRG